LQIRNYKVFPDAVDEINVASRVCLIDSSYPLRPNLELLVRNLDRDTVRCKRLIRQFLEEDSAAFLRAATSILKKQADSPGAQFLIALLVESSLLLQVLSDSGVSRECAFEVARAAMAHDAMTDVTLARALVQTLSEPEPSLNLEQISRIMEILEEISDGARIFPSLVRLLRHASSNVRSKAVLMIGRGSHSTQWVRHRLSADTDPRIRANAIEGLWGVDTEEARQLLQSLVHDPNNRVAGNAILGLYRLGDSSMIPEVMSLARHESAMFRATAAWVMGESGDPRFTEVLAALMRDPNSILRKRAFSALGSIRSEVSKLGQTPCRMAAQFVDAEGQKGTRRVSLAVAGEGKGPAPGILPTQVLLWEDGQMVTSYRVTERPLPETNSIVFILPFPAEGVPSWNATALECLPWKRPSDLWACSYYAVDQPEMATMDETAARFLSSPDAIAAEFGKTPQRAHNQDVWHAIWQAVEAGSIVGKRQLIVFSQGNVTSGAGHELISAVAAARAGVQVITSGPDRRLEDFCRKVNGVCWDASLMVDAYVSMLAKYEIVYHSPGPGAQALKIRLHAQEVRGELTLPISLPDQELKLRSANGRTSICSMI
jgi:HEAT repeat protein